MWNSLSQGRVEIWGEAQQGENLLLHQSQWRYMANELPWQLHLGQGDRHKGLQEAFCRRRGGGFARAILVESHQRRSLLLQATAHHVLQEREHAHCNTQQMRQSDHLIFPLDKHGRNGERDPF